MKNKFLISITVLLFSTLSCLAQGRILTLVEANPSARNAAMGHTLLGNTSDMYLYTNPSALVFSDKELSVDFSGELYPKEDFGRLSQYNLSAGYKVGEKSAIFVGGRYFGGLTLPTTNGEADISPYEWTADIAYAFQLMPELSIYASASYVNSYQGTKARGLGLSVGLGYQKVLVFDNKPSLLTLGLRVLDMGKPVKFDDTKLPYSLPTSVILGGDWSINVAKHHQFTYALSGRYFTPKDATELLISTGGEYTYNEMVSARLGYQYAQNGADCVTMGLGGKYSGLSLNLSYNHTFAIYGQDTFMFGLGFEL